MSGIVIIKQATDRPHFTKPFEGGSTSDRVILPGPDHCMVKVTMFRPKAGFKADHIRYDCDETVHILSGQVNIHEQDDDGEIVIELKQGSTYHAAADVEYGMSVPVDSILFCVFSPAVVFPVLPDNQ